MHLPRLVSFALAGLAAAALFSFATPAVAVQDTEAFAELRNEFDNRLQNELANPADKAAKKQRKAIEKCIKALDKSSTKLSKDVKTAGKCVNFLKKPFADELTIIFKIDDFRVPLGNLTMALNGRISDRLGALGDVADSLDDKTAGKVRKQAGKADDAIIAAQNAGDFKSKFKNLAKAAKFLEKGEKIADKKRLGGKAKDNQVVMLLDGEKWVSDPNQIRTEFSTNDNGLRVFGRRARQDGGWDELEIRFRDFDGPGRYPLDQMQQLIIRYSEKPNGGPPDVVYDALLEGGIVIVDEASTNPASYRIRFAFSVRNAQQGTKQISGGASHAGLGNIFGLNFLFL